MMKQFPKFTFLIGLLVFSIIACEKETVVPDPSEIDVRLSKIIYTRDASRIDETTLEYHSNGLLSSSITQSFKDGDQIHTTGVECHYDSQNRIAKIETMDYGMKEMRITYEWYNDSCVTFFQNYFYDSDELRDISSKSVYQYNDENQVNKTEFYVYYDDNQIEVLSTIYYKWFEGNLLERSVYDQNHNFNRRDVYHYNENFNLNPFSYREILIGTSINCVSQSTYYNHENQIENRITYSQELNDQNLPTRSNLSIDGVVIPEQYYKYEYIEIN